METISKEFFSFIKNNSIPAISKLFIGVVIFISIIFIDNISGFSYYYNVENKLNSLQKISSVLKDNQLNSKSREHILEIQNEILTRKTLKDEFLIHWNNISFVNSNNEIINQAGLSIIKRNKTIEFLSLNYFFIICFCFFPFYWISKPLVQNFWKNILIIIIAEISIAVFGFILYFFSSLIPTLFGKPIFNYILNFLIVTSFLTLNTIRIKRKNNNIVN